MKLPKSLTTVTSLSKGLALALYFVLMGLGFWLGMQYERSQRPPGDIRSYQECVDAGYPVAESFPTQCIVPGGPSFTNPDQKVE